MPRSRTRPAGPGLQGGVIVGHMEHSRAGTRRRLLAAAAGAAVAVAAGRAPAFPDEPVSTRVWLRHDETAASGLDHGPWRRFLPRPPRPGRGRHRAGALRRCRRRGPAPAPGLSDAAAATPITAPVAERAVRLLDQPLQRVELILEHLSRLQPARYRRQPVQAGTLGRGHRRGRRSRAVAGRHRARHTASDLARCAHPLRAQLRLPGLPRSRGAAL